MLTHWNNLINTDCLIVKIGPHTVYPIFRVGYSTLLSVCDQKYVNNQIKKIDHIDVMIRDPEERFVSGVNEYCRQNKLQVDEVYKAIQNGDLVDRHFAPQYIWLMHLSKYHKASITIRPFDYINKITNAHKNKSKNKISIPVCRSFVAVDQCLTKHYNQTMSLDEIIRRYRNVLS